MVVRLWALSVVRLHSLDNLIALKYELDGKHIHQKKRKQNLKHPKSSSSSNKHNLRDKHDNENKTRVLRKIPADCTLLLICQENAQIERERMQAVGLLFLKMDRGSNLPDYIYKQLKKN